MDWSLYRCATAGHLTYAPDEPELRERLSAGTAPAELWRCLRCGLFVPGTPDAHGPAAQAPAVRRGKEIRSEIILRVFAVERVIRFVLLGAFSYLVWQFRNSQLTLRQDFNRELPLVHAIFRDLGINVDKRSGIVGIVNHALQASPQLLMWLAIGLAVFAVVELVEGIGLWLGQRWGEYFAMIVTSLGLPYEIYDISSKFTWVRLGALLINIALVLYLVLTRRLFGVRGGKHAYEARLRSMSVIDEAVRAAAAQRAATAAPGPSAVPAAVPGLSAVPAAASDPPAPAAPAAPPPAG
jgi:uncharacterized membrane protein (DUF2068 family)